LKTYKAKFTKDKLVSALEGLLANSPLSNKEICATLNVRFDSACRYYRQQTGRTMTEFRIANGNAYSPTIHRFKDSVLKFYPEADAYRYSPQRPWIICKENNPDVRNVQIGKGSTSQDAWMDAYNTLRKEGKVK
jgi:hypothetical protein